MSNPWDKSFVKEDSELLDMIMSEALFNRLDTYEGFVWVDDKNKPFAAPLKKHICAFMDITKVMQTAEDTMLMTQSHNNNDEDEEEEVTTFLEDEYFEEFHYVKYKSDNLIKIKYPLPQWLKRKEHGTLSTTKNKNTPLFASEVKKKLKDGINELLPNIKLDVSTTAVLEKLIHNRYLGDYGNVIGRGKKSIVFYAHCHWKNCITMPFHNAVKVYKLDGNKDNNKIIFKRVQREFENLTKIHKFLPLRGYAPWPIRAWNNVIVMSFYDHEQDLSQAIKDIPSDIKLVMYQAIVDFILKVYNKTHLVHGKLCPKNIVFCKTYPYVIGWSHSVKSDHPEALSKLMKDCKFVTEFFVKHGVKVISTEELFKNITGVSRIGNKLMKIITEKDLFQKYNTNPNRRSQSLTKPKINFRFK